MRLKILFIGHSYHTVTKSSEFFINQLKAIGDVSTEFDDCWKGKVENDYRPIIKSFDMVIVWQLPQVIRRLANADHENIIFVPMYDSIHSLDKTFWRKLKHIKIVSFSSTVRAICLSHQLDTFFIQYYPEQVKLAEVGYGEKRMFFWQRRPWPNWRALTSILPACQFEKLHLHVALDPGVEMTAEQDIQPTLSETQQKRFGTSVWFDEKNDLLAKLKEFNLFFLPREREGIGFSFLDSMENGMIPVGFNQATFNEYVVDGINGFVVDKKQRFDLPDLHPVVENMKHYIAKGRANYLRKLEGLEAFLLKPVDPPNYYESWIHNIAPKFQRRWRARKIPAITASRRRFEDISPLVSIVTVVKDDVVGFARTHQSICSQSYDNFEYIVIDGKSTDRTLESIKAHEASIDHLTSAKDKGPYDAMMKGALVARGRYILFMNAGDEFAESTSLEDAMEAAPVDADIIYGHHYYIRQSLFTKLHLARDLASTYRMLKGGKLTFPWLGGIPCHQSTLITKDLILDIKFDPTLQVAADHALLFSACERGAKAYHSNTVISKYYAGGLSGKMKSLCVKDWKKIALKYAEDRESAAAFYDKMK
jgi:Glycosyl transferase family 2/Glycosyl transferases group 1